MSGYTNREAQEILKGACSHQRQGHPYQQHLDPEPKRAYDVRNMNANTISVWIAELGIWPLVVVLVPNLMFRKYGQSAGKKRMSSLMQAIAVFLITTASSFIVEKELTEN